VVLFASPVEDARMHGACVHAILRDLLFSMDDIAMCVNRVWCVRENIPMESEKMKWQNVHVVLYSIAYSTYPIYI